MWDPQGSPWGKKYSIETIAIAETVKELGAIKIVVLSVVERGRKRESKWYGRILFIDMAGLQEYCIAVCPEYLRNDSLGM